jgi:hypothetical protein
MESPDLHEAPGTLSHNTQMQPEVGGGTFKGAEASRDLHFAGFVYATFARLIVGSFDASTAMESIERLRVVLLNVVNGRVIHNGEQELFDELMVHKSALVNLFDVGPRSQQEQRELESGALTKCSISPSLN